MKKDGYAESTIKTTGKRLRMMARDGVNLDDPDMVKKYIAAKETSNGYKEILCDVYDRHAKYNGLTWRRPRYERDDQPPYVPTEEEVNLLIANAGKKYAFALSVLRDTGMRPIELERSTFAWYDLTRGSACMHAHLVNFKSDEYSVRVAETIQEVCKLVEAGFEYITDVDGSKIFRKRK